MPSDYELTLIQVLTGLKNKGVVKRLFVQNELAKMLFKYNFIPASYHFQFHFYNRSTVYSETYDDFRK